MHTPTPWKTSDHCDIDDANGCGVCSMFADERSNDNAAFIVQACNAHDTLVARVAELEDIIRDASNIAGEPGSYAAMVAGRARTALNGCKERATKYHALWEALQSAVFDLAEAKPTCVRLNWYRTVIAKGKG